MNGLAYATSAGLPLWHITGILTMSRRYRGTITRPVTGIHVAVCFVGLLLCIFSYAEAGNNSFVGSVVSVKDGDTIAVLTPDKRQVKIRLSEIDAPEQSQAFGQRSKQSLSNLVFGKQVTVHNQGTDRYNRVLGRVFVDQVDVNKEQIRLGFAWVYRQYARDNALFAIEEQAEQSKVGLWADAKPVPPREFRHGTRLAEKGGDVTSGTPPSSSAPVSKDSANQFTCGGKRKCGDMSSCEEARFYLTECGLYRLDGDHDGTPCESLCR